MRFQLVIVLLWFGVFNYSLAQQADSLTVFYHPNGEKSSEGRLFDGKPDGYWRTFYENDQLKSEGNR